jgi:hypothetical protein
MHLPLVAVLAFGAVAAGDTEDVGPFVRALWLVQQYGTPEACKVDNDRRTKGILFKALDKDGAITFSKLDGLIESATFKRLAGNDDRLNPAASERAVAAAIPESRRALLPKVRAHADFLTTSFDMIDAPHREAGATLADWIAKNYRPGQPLNVIVVCTGNSRRSMFGATLGNIAAAYHGMPEIHFFSGGTAPTTFNPRTVKALQAIGVQVESTGKEARRGEPQTANPIYRVRWGESLETTEFSKQYADPSNPQRGFAALMVCGEADAACPVVKGAALRVSMPYLEPKIYDGSAYETAKYAERRDDIGRLMLAVMMQARNRLAASETASR